MGKRVIVFTSETMHPQEHRMFIQWLGARVPCDGVFKPEGAVTFAHLLVEDNKAEILCVIAINNWTATTCEGHIASDGTGRWMSRELAYTVYQYVFEQAQRTRFNFVVDVNNNRAVTMHEKLGHFRECRLADAYGEDQDAYLYGLTRKQWIAGRFVRPFKEKR